MDATIQTSVTISKTLFDQAETLAAQLNLSLDQLFEMALAQFIQSSPTSPQETKPEADVSGEPVVNQGEIYWIQFDGESGAESSIPHPYVVIQDNVLNHSRITTVVVCALTSNIQRASLPGNVLLYGGEANLPKTSVVEVSKISTVEKTQLGAYIGTLDDRCIQQILAGIRFVQTSFIPAKDSQ